jgi:hypothetical protein
MVSARGTFDKTQSTAIYDNKDISYAFGKFSKEVTKNLLSL